MPTGDKSDAMRCDDDDDDDDGGGGGDDGGDDDDDGIPIQFDPSTNPDMGFVACRQSIQWLTWQISTCKYQEERRCTQISTVSKTKTSMCCICPITSYRKQQKIFEIYTKISTRCTGTLWCLIEGGLEKSPKPNGGG